MYGKRDKIGYYTVGNVTSFLSYFVILVFGLFSISSFAQSASPIPLQNALLELAREEKLSIVFTSTKIPDKEVFPLSTDQSIPNRLSHLLNDTNLYFEIQDGQIFLFRKNRVYGYVEDRQSGERLISATLLIQHSGMYELTNDFGYYSILTRSDTVNLEVSYIGYQTQLLTVVADELEGPLNILLQQDNNLTEVLITDKLVSKDDRKYIELDKGSDILLTQNQAITALGGEPDLFQTLVRQSGVSSGSDGIGGIHIRGGKNDQNLILFEGVKLYNSAHAFGMFSIANSTVVDQIRLHKYGASGADFGRLSSVVDVKTKDPNLNSANGIVQFSTLASQATVELPLVKDRLGVLFSGRRTHIDPYINHVTDKSINGIAVDGESGYDFYDLNMKLHGKLNDKNRLFLSIYQGRDNYTDVYNADLLDFEPPLFVDEDIFYRWKNRLAVLRWNRLMGSSTIANFQVSGYQYDYRNKYDVDSYDEFFEEFPSYSHFASFNSQTTNYELKADFETITERHHFKYGFHASSKSYQIGEFVDTVLLSGQNDFRMIDGSNLDATQYLGYSNLEGSIYVSDKLKVSDQWMVEGGLYGTVHRTRDEDFVIDPIFGLAGYFKTLNKINANIYVGGSIGSFFQTEHLLTTADNGYPNDIWVPSTDLVTFQRSNQIELFSEFEVKNHSLRMAAYYKNQIGLLRCPFDAELPGLGDIISNFWEQDIELGEAEGYGIELDYSYTMHDQLSLRAVYSYGKMDYQFDGINDGRAFPFDYSIPHTFSLGSNIRLSSKFRLVIDWFYSTGKPFTLYESESEYTPLDLSGISDDAALSAENALRLPEAHKLSIMLSTHWKWSSIQNNLSLGVQNVYNQRNVILQYELIGEGLQSQRSFPILPMVLWRITFGNQ
ncbi:MAG: carboxypeptidase-like regulatory domain-containing protein [Bacteroidota bacterium]